MKLGEIGRLIGTPLSEGTPHNIEIQSIVTSSLDADSHSLFYAKDGKRHLAKDTVGDAIARGCRAILTEKRLPNLKGAFVFSSGNAEKIAKVLEEHLFFDVLNQIRFIFVTGTKGKTTTAKMVAHILNRFGIPCAVCGTLGFEFQDIYTSFNNTTPDIYTLLPHLSRARDKGALYCVLEVSSQALACGRVDGLKGTYAIFTGIGTDHIDATEHESFFAYREAKRRLFCDFGIKESFAPRNISLAPFMTGGVEKQYFTDTKAPSHLTLYPVKMSKTDILYTDGCHSDTLPLCGEFHLQNASLALLCCSKIVCAPPHELFPLLRDFSIEGRGEHLTLGGREIIIDYAHNAESVESLARSYRSFAEGRMIAVCGSVGDKARLRRKDLARALEESFDLVVLTEDDTVTESQMAIAYEMLSYFEKQEKAKVIFNREYAILFALGESREGDMVFVLGKGHEHFLLRQGERIMFDEKEIIKRFFNENTE